MKTNTIVLALATAALSASGCAASELSQQKLVDTQSAIDAAKEIDASGNPDVALHIRYANDQIAVARQLDEEGEDRAAQRMLDRAQADAELALALARTERSRQAAQDAWDEVEDLRNK